MNEQISRIGGSPLIVVCLGCFLSSIAIESKNDLSDCLKSKFNSKSLDRINDYFCLKSKYFEKISINSRFVLNRCRSSIAISAIDEDH